MDLKEFLLERLSEEVKTNENIEASNTEETIENEEGQLKEDELNEEELNEAETIKSEEDFRAAARAKFEKVFGDKLDEEKMKNIVDGILDKYKEDAEAGEWGKLIGILNKSF